MHSTDDLDDGYMGSGTKLLKDIKEYGADRYTREILEFADSREELVKLEAEIVTENVANNWYCLNKVVGGGNYTKGDPVYVNRWYAKNGMKDTEFVDIIKEGEEPKREIDRLVPYYESRGWVLKTPLTEDTMGDVANDNPKPWTCEDWVLADKIMVGKNGVVLKTIPEILPNYLEEGWHLVDSNSPEAETCVVTEHCSECNYIS